MSWLLVSRRPDRAIATLLGRNDELNARSLGFQVVGNVGDGDTIRIATNAGDPDGIAVTNVSYHLEAEGAGIQLIVPPETVAIARSGRLETSSQLTPGSLVTSMFLFGITEDPKALGIGDGDAIRGVRGKAGNQLGVGQLTLHVHCDPDFEKLFPDNRGNPRESTEVNVV